MTSPDRPLSPTVRSLHLGDSASAWSDAGFLVADHSVRLGALTLRLEQPVSAPHLGFDRPLQAGDSPTRHLPWIVETEKSLPDGPAEGVHPNGISDIDHIVLMAPDQDALRKALDGANLEIRRERPASIAGKDVIQFFVWAGPVLLEIVAPAEPQPLSGPRAGISVWGIAVVSDDIQSTAEWFGDTSSPVRPAVQPGRLITTLRTQALDLGLTVAVMTKRDAEPEIRRD